MEETINISKSEYDDLKQKADFLEALNAAGVDNWDGYGYAQEIFEQS